MLSPNFPSSRRPIGRRRYAPGLAAVAALLLLAACAGKGSPTQAGGQSPAARPSAEATSPPGAAGTIAAITGSQLEVQNPSLGQVTVTLTSKTRITETVKGSISELAVGDCVVAAGQAATATGQAPGGASPGTGPFTASTIRIDSTTQTCTGQRGGQFGGGAGGGTFPRPTRSPFPTPSNGLFPRRAFGKVMSISGSTLVIEETNPRNNATTSIDVTLAPTVTVTKVVNASKSALAVGRCASAFGPADETGAITAQSIDISSPGPSGCSFGGFGGGRGGFPGSFGPGPGATPSG